MKMMIILATLAFAAIAQATPTVGDYSKFKMTVSNGQQSVVGSYEVALVGQEESGYKMSSTTTFPNQPAEYSEVVPADQLATDSDLTAVLSSCAQYGGKTEQTKVPAGTFTTCAMPTQTGMIWMGQVPFGVIKQTQKTQEGYLVTLELEMYVAGKQ